MNFFGQSKILREARSDQEFVNGGNKRALNLFFFFSFVSIKKKSWVRFYYKLLIVNDPCNQTGLSLWTNSITLHLSKQPN